MIVSKMIPTPNFWACVGTVSANEVVPHTNTRVSHYNDCMYIVEGLAEVTDGETTIPLVAGELADLKPLRGSDTTFTIGSYQTTWIAFNPKRLDQDLDVEIHTEDQTVSDECILFCMIGSITVNGKQVISEQFVRVSGDSPVDVQVTGDALYAVVKG